MEVIKRIAKMAKIEIEIEDRLIFSFPDRTKINQNKKATSIII